MKTHIPKNIEKKWFLINAENQVLGKVATKICNILRGKNKPTFTPHMDTGDYIVVTNTQKMKLTGNKLEDKMYYNHSGYPGGLKETPAKKLMDENPNKILYNAVKGMLPKNKLRDKFLKKLHLYSVNEHPHEAQKPQEITV